jgi:hypothetical protein
VYITANVSIQQNSGRKGLNEYLFVANKTKREALRAPDCYMLQQQQQAGATPFVVLSCVKEFPSGHWFVPRWL